MESLVVRYPHEEEVLKDEEEEEIKSTASHLACFM
jgi:hypothetical protein